MKKETSWKRRVLSRLSRELALSPRRLEDLPPEFLREVQKSGFPDMRSFFLEPSKIRRFIREPILNDFLVTRVGYCSRAEGHYIPRPEGSLDNILIYCIAGKGWLDLAGARFDIVPGTMIVLPCGIPHRYGADAVEPWSNYWVHFTGRQSKSYLDLLEVNEKQPLIASGCSDELISALRLVEAYVSRGQDRSELIAASTAFASFLGLVNLRQSKAKSHEGSTEEKIRGSIEFMRANFARPIALRELAGLANMSVTRFEAAFRKVAGSSCIKYLTGIRIEMARKLLCETDMPAKVVASESGYDDPYYFSRIFKVATGMPPTEFRKKSRPIIRGGGD